MFKTNSKTEVNLCVDDIRTSKLNRGHSHSAPTCPSGNATRAGPSARAQGVISVNVSATDQTLLGFGGVHQQGSNFKKKKFIFMPLKTIELTQTASLQGPRNKWKSIAIPALLTYFIGLLICSGLLLLDLLSLTDLIWVED